MKFKIIYQFKMEGNPQIELFEKSILCVAAERNENYKAAESYIITCFNDVSFKSFQCVLDIIFKSTSHPIVEYAFILLRRYIDIDGRGCWSQMSFQNRSAIRAKFVEYFRNMPSSHDIAILRQACFSVCNILEASIVLSDRCTELEDIAYEMMKSNESNKIECALIIVRHIAFLNGDKAILYGDILKEKIDDYKIKGLTIHVCACNLACEIACAANKFDLLENYILHIKAALNACVVGKKRNELKSLLDSLIACARKNTDFSSKNMNELFDLCISISYRKSECIDDDECFMMLQFVSAIVKKFPSSITLVQFQELSVRLFKLIADCQNIPDLKECPQNTLVGMGLFRNIFKSIDPQSIMPVLNGLYDLARQEKEWNNMYAFFMAISQICENTNSLSKLETFINDGIDLLNSDACAQVQYSILHLLGELADNCGDWFCIKYGGMIIPVLCKAMKNENELVSAHAYAVLVNLIPHLQRSCFKSMSASIIAPILESKIKSNKVKEESIKLISQCSLIFGSEFTKKEITDLIEFMSTSIATEKHAGVRCSMIECISTLANFAELSQVEKINYVVIQEFIKFDATNKYCIPLIPCYISAIQRMVINLKNNFSFCFAKVFTKMLEITELLISSSTNHKDENDIKKSKRSLNKPNLEAGYNPEIECIIEAFIILQNSIPDCMLSYAECLYQLLEPLLYSSNKPIILEGVYHLLYLLQRTLMQSNEEEATKISYSKRLINSLWIICLKIPKFNELNQLLLTLKNVIKAAGPIFNEAEINKQKRYIISLLDRSIDKYESKTTQKAKQQNPKQFVIALAMILEKYFHFYPQFCAKHLITDLYTYIINLQSLPEMCEELHILIIYICVDALQFLLPSRINSFVRNFTDIILECCTNKFASVRKVALYGIGILAIVLPESDYVLICEQSIKLLKEAYKLQIENNAPNLEEELQAKDNAVSAFGKIIRYKYMSLNSKALIWEFIEMLPLSIEKREAQACYEFLHGILSINIEALEFDEIKMQKFVKAMLYRLESDTKSKRAICCIHNTLKSSMYGPSYINAMQGLSEQERKIIAYLN